MKKPKNKIIIFVSIVVAVALALSVIFMHILRRTTLSPEYYGSTEIVNIDTEELKTLISEKKSFLVFVSQSGCRTADDLKKHISEIQVEYPMRVLEIDFSVLKSSGLADSVKHYPSLLVYDEGELVAFLRADNSDDTDAYLSVAGLTEWLSAHIKMR